MKSSPVVEVVHVDESTDRDAWQLLRARQDKEWTLVDCASFVVARRRKVREVFGFDHDFVAMGFVLRPS